MSFIDVTKSLIGSVGLLTVALVIPFRLTKPWSFGNIGADMVGQYTLNFTTDNPPPEDPEKRMFVLGQWIIIPHPK